MDEPTLYKLREEYDTLSYTDKDGAWRAADDLIAALEDALRKEQRQVDKLDADLIALEAENKRLKCCGNCEHLFEDGYYGSHNDTTSESWYACREFDNLSNRVEPSGQCVFVPSRWTRREI